MSRRGTILAWAARLAAVLAATTSIAGLIYRGTLYWKIPVAPGDPYGLGDLIDALFGLAVIGAGAGCAIASMILLVFLRPQARLAGIVGLTGALSVAAYFWLHSLIPRLVS